MEFQVVCKFVFLCLREFIMHAALNEETGTVNLNVPRRVIVIFAVLI